MRLRRRGVLVGRGVLRNPWILAQAADLVAGRTPRTVTMQERGQFLLDYIDLLLDQREHEQQGFRHVAPGIVPAASACVGARALGYQQAASAVCVVLERTRLRLASSGCRQQRREYPAPPSSHRGLLHECPGDGLAPDAVRRFTSFARDRGYASSDQRERLLCVSRTGAECAGRGIPRGTVPFRLRERRFIGRCSASVCGARRAVPRSERRALPAVALTTNQALLTAWSNDYQFDDIFARQIEGLGQSGRRRVGDFDERQFRQRRQRSSSRA